MISGNPDNSWMIFHIFERKICIANTLEFSQSDNAKTVKPLHLAVTQYWAVDDKEEKHIVITCEYLVLSDS